jgi:cell division transport system ATP-binding protein
MINIKNVTKIYPQSETPALRNVQFRVQPGEFVSIVGQSGSGKTTLVKLLIAEEKPTKGQILLGDWDVGEIRASEVPHLRRQIGVIFQDFKLLPQKTVYENVAFALEACGAPTRQIKAVVPQLLKIVNLDDKADRYPRQLSGGEQQRVVIARSLAHRPKLLVADEPTGNLDALNAKEITNLLLKINQFGTTVLLVTHNREIVNSLKRRVITLDQGMLVNDAEVGKYII